MFTQNKILRQRSSELTAFVTSLSIAIIAIKKSSEFLLKKCPVIDIETNEMSSIETLSFKAVTLFGEIIEITYEGINARKVHRIITAAFSITDKEVLPFRVIGGLKGKSFGSPLSPYRSIRPPADGVNMSIICDKELGDGDLIYPVTNEEAEEYAFDEHQVKIPVEEWHNPAHSALSIGEFLVCRSPFVVKKEIAQPQAPFSNVIMKVEAVKLATLFD